MSGGDAYQFGHHRREGQGGCQSACRGVRRQAVHAQPNPDGVAQEVELGTSFQPCLGPCGTCRVQDVTWRPLEMGGDSLGERLELIQRPSILFFVVGRGEMGHHRAEF